MVHHNSEQEKYIVFDVDETLGYFSQLGSFIDAISFYNKDFSGAGGSGMVIVIYNPYPPLHP